MKTLFLYSILSLPGLIALPAQAEQRTTVRAVLQAQDPPVQAVIEQALKNYRVNPEAVASLRSSASTRAWMPMLAAGYRYGDDRFVRFQRQEITAPTETNESTNARNDAITLGAVWDFRELVFNPSELQVYGLVGIQRDIMLDVTKNYFLRRQLLLRMKYDPPKEPVDYETTQIRIAEYTAVLDGLTAGWFSQQLKN